MYKRSGIAVVLFLFLISTCAYASNMPDNSNQADKNSNLPRMQYYGKIKLDEDSFDFGYTPQKVRVSHIFWVKNTGKDTLEIERARPGCSCTKALVFKRLVPVGDSSPVEIVFSSGYYRGEVKKQPSIKVSDQDSPDHILNYRSYVLYNEDSTYTPMLEFESEMLEIITGQEKDQYEVRVKNVSDQPLKMSLAATDSRALDVTVPTEEIKPGKDAVITVKLVNMDYYKIPGFEKSFTLELSDANHSRYTFPVRYAHESIKKPKGGYPDGWGK